MRKKLKKEKQDPISLVWSIHLKANIYYFVLWVYGSITKEQTNFLLIIADFQNF